MKNIIIILLLLVCIASCSQSLKVAEDLPPTKVVEILPPIEVLNLSHRVIIYPDLYPEVCGIIDNTLQIPIASGTLIGKRTVLTAGHVTLCSDSFSEVMFGSTLYKIKCTETHPNYKAKSTDADDDLGIIILEKDVKDIVPATINSKTLLIKDQGNIITPVGHSTLNKSYAEFGSARLYFITSEAKYFTWLANEHHLYFGDSGGGVFRFDSELNREVLIGVNSIFQKKTNIISRKTEYYIDSSAVRVDCYIDWINEKLQEYDQ